MSDRSAKLLLEVAEMIEAKEIQEPYAFRKLGGGLESVPFRAGLVAEIRKWRNGYLKHLEEKHEARAKGVLPTPPMPARKVELACLVDEISSVLRTIDGAPKIDSTLLGNILWVLGMCYEELRKEITR